MNIKKKETFFDLIPEEIKTYIWKIYFTNYVISKIRKMKPENKWISPSKRLCNLCKDTGALQTGKNIDNLVFPLFNRSLCNISQLICSHSCTEYNCTRFESFTLNKNKKINCTNCIYYGFPCLSCNLYFSERIGFIGLWHCSRDIKSTNNGNYNLLLKEDYIVNNNFNKELFEFDALNNNDEAYYPEN